MAADLGDRAFAGLEVMGVLGHGSRTVVHQVRRGDREYALKVLRTSAVDEESMRGFQREAALLACVNDPGIPRVHEVGIARGRPYLVMDLVAGRRLTEALTTGPLDVSRVVAVGMEVGRALTTAHRLGLVHRDVKPDNIIIDAAGHANLIDFGLAARATGELDDAVAGTMVYSAPEQSGLLRRPGRPVRPRRRALRVRHRPTAVRLRRSG